MSDFKKVGFVTCAALVMANMIGTGVFTSLGYQVGPLPSAFVILMLWGLGGVVAFCGAMSYAELAATLPRSGGEYNFLSRIYHPAAGFMAGFVSVTVGFSAPIALAAIAFGRYLHAAVPSIPPGVASTVIVLIAALAHSLTVRAGGNFQVVVTTAKVTLICGFIVAGFWLTKPGDFAPQPGDANLFFSGSFAISLMYVLYSYSGWNAAAYIVGEVKNPQKTVPRALLTATGFVTVLYVLLNAVFLRSAPLADYAGKTEVGEIAATHVLGAEGGRILSILISLGLCSTISAMTWAGPRVAQTVGRDYSVLAFLSRTSPGGVPRVALGLQTALVLGLLWTSSFESVLIYAQYALLLCGFTTVLGLFVLRIRQPDLPRPFRCVGYPFTPAIYLLVNLFALVYSAIEKPWQALAGFGTLAVGLALFFLARNKSKAS